MLRYYFYYFFFRTDKYIYSLRLIRCSMLMVMVCRLFRYFLLLEIINGIVKFTSLNCIL